jgi:hypothetical protein
MSKQYSSSITRPNDTIAYTAGDVVGGVLIFTGVELKSSQVTTADKDIYRVLSGSLMINRSGIPTGMGTFTLHLYSSTPPSAYADNAIWDLPSGDRSSYLGSITSDAVVSRGSTLIAKFKDSNEDILINRSSLWAYIVTDTAFTPAASTVKTAKINLLVL